MLQVRAKLAGRQTFPFEEPLTRKAKEGLGILRDSVLRMLQRDPDVRITIPALLEEWKSLFQGAQTTTTLAPLAPRTIPQGNQVTQGTINQGKTGAIIQGDQDVDMTRDTTKTGPEACDTTAGFPTSGAESEYTQSTPAPMQLTSAVTDDDEATRESLQQQQ